MTPPIHETAYRPINYGYDNGSINFYFSWTIEGIVKSPVDNQIQIGVGADAYLFGDTIPTISSTWPNIVYKTFPVTLGQYIPFFMKNDNDNWSATVNFYYKGADNIEKKFGIGDTYYFSGISSNSPWIIQDYKPVVTSSSELSFKDIVYSNCDGIYSDMAIHKSWPTLCNSHYVSNTVQKCQTCVSNATLIGYSCICNTGYYEKVSTNSCISTSPIMLKLHKVSQTSNDVMVLVISNPCVIDNTSNCKETGDSRYLTKTRYTIFTLNTVDSTLQAEDCIDPDGAYTIFINNLKYGGMKIKCYSNTLFQGVPFYEATDSIINHSFSTTEFHDKPTSCMIYGYLGTVASTFHTFYIQGSDTVTNYINDSRITTQEVSGAEVSFTEYYQAPTYIPIRIEIINTSKSLDISFQVDSGSGRFNLQLADCYNPTIALGEVWEISPNNKHLYVDQKIIENNIDFCGQGCITCNFNLNGTSTCLICIDNASLNESSCICNNSYYYDSSSNICNACSELCTTCSDAKFCTSC